MRRSIAAAAAACLLALGLFAAGAAAALRDDVPTLPQPTTTVAVPEPTSTAAVTTTAPPTTTAPTTTAAPAPAGVPARTTPRPSCAQGSDLAVLPPGRAAYATAAVPRARACAGGGSAPAARAAARVAELAFLSVAADAVAVRAVPVAGGWTLRARVAGLRVGGRPVAYGPGLDVPLGRWGRLLGTTQAGGLAAPLAIELARPVGGLPGGTTVLVGYVGSAGAFRPEPRVPSRLGGAFPPTFPLPVLPELKAGPYTFPVAGTVSFGDSFGGPRSDVSGGWHHGDDIFARLGQPVLAVADGTVYSVGWEHLGGWRLWLKDNQGNRFYYAHLSGYTKLARNRTKVHAGDVIGFIGHTGDAYTTPWHLHFEIHPASLLRLRYDGAVNPTSYLESWRRNANPRVLPPAPLPAGAAEHGQGAVSDYRQLLALRPRPVAAATAKLPAGLPASAPAAAALHARAARGGSSHWVAALVAAAVALALAALAVTFRSAPGRSRLRLRRPGGGPRT
jgi:murein DD-endopeptidase MepM/ murein hydrolase activator NlpD